MLIEEPGLSLAVSPKKPEGAEWAPPVKVIDGVQYRSDGRGCIHVGHQHVFVIPAVGATPHQLTHGPFDHGS